MLRITKPLLSAALAGVAFIGVAGCQSDNGYAAGTRGVDLDVRQSNDKIYAGEIVTFRSHTENTLGKNAELKWQSTGGDLKTEDSGQIARVKFDRPGVYNVKAQLVVDGKVIKEESKVVEVASLE